MRTLEDMKVDLKGAVVECMGIAAKIEKVLYAEHWDRYGWDIEFIDDRGHYRHWKQYEDGGRLKKPLINPEGFDMTDVFRKYGYNV